MDKCMDFVYRFRVFNAIASITEVLDKKGSNFLSKTTITQKEAWLSHFKAEDR